MDEISEEARVIGAVNCVKVSHPNGHPYLVGYNTDMYGFRKALLEFIPAAISKALILGNGGAAKAVRYALHSLNMEYRPYPVLPARQTRSAMQRYRT